MPTYSKEKEQYFIERIRLIMVRKPDTTILKVQEILAGDTKSPIQLNRNYVGKLMRKVRGRQAHRLNQYTVNQYLAGFEDEVGELKKRLWSIIQTSASEQAKIMAIKELRESSGILFDKMFYAGVFDNNTGKKSEPKLSPEEDALLTKALNYATGRAEQSRIRDKGG